MPGSMSNTPAFPCTTTALLCKNSLSCVNTTSATCFSMGILPLVVCDRLHRAVRLYSAFMALFLVTHIHLAPSCSHPFLVSLRSCAAPFIIHHSSINSCATSEPAQGTFH